MEASRKVKQEVEGRREEQREVTRVLRDRKNCLVEMVVGLMDQAVKELDEQSVELLMKDITHLQAKTSELESSYSEEKKISEEIDGQLNEAQIEFDELGEQKQILEKCVGGMIVTAQDERESMIKSLI